MSICGAAHETGVLCEMPKGQHPWHTAVMPGSVPPQGVDWQNTEYSAPVRHRTRAGREQHKAMLRAATSTDPLEAAKAHWQATKPEWIKEAKSTLHAYCAVHSEPFTTPEDIWPLIDAPAEMRAFSLVVQHALRRRWIVEVDTVRLRGDYLTRDGVPFQANKIVPIYQSRIARLDL